MFFISEKKETVLKKIVPFRKMHNDFHFCMLSSILGSDYSCVSVMSLQLTVVEQLQ